MMTTTTSKPGCAVRGSLQNGKAMCGYIIVGGKLCGLPETKGTCPHQQPGSAIVAQGEKK